MKYIIYLIILLLLLLQFGSAYDTNKFYIIDITPNALSPSDLKTVKITVENTLIKPAYKVGIEIFPEKESPVKVVGELKKEIGFVGVKERFTVDYDIYIDKNAENGVYYVPMKILWKKSAGEEETMEETLYFSIRITGELKRANIDILNVTTIPEKVMPGDDFSLRINIKNVGNSDAKSLKSRLIIDSLFIPVGSDTEKYIGSLGVNETVSIEFNMYVKRSAESGEYPLRFVLEYEDEFSRTNIKNTTIGVVVKGSPRIYIQEIIIEPSKLTTDTEGLFMIRLINTGTEKAEDVKVRIAGADKILTEGHQFIGEIAPEESQTVSFGVSVDEDAEIGKHGLKIDISYQDTFGKSYENSKIYEITVFAAEPFIPTEYIYALIAIVVLSLIIYLIIAVRFKEEE